VNWLDLFIILFLVSAFVRGSEVGFIRQFFSTVGFFVGLFLGAWLQGLLIHHLRTPASRALFAVILTLGFALAFMAIGEYYGLVAKFKVRHAHLTNRLDKIFGSVLACITLLAAVWLAAAVFRNVPDSGWQRQIRASRVVTLLDNNLPSAPNLLTKLGHLIDPNGFPQVFTGLEQNVQTDMPLPDMGDLNPAVAKDRPSVVKIEGDGCGNIVDGSGFVVNDQEVVTNAHVVAGVDHPTVIDQGGTHGAKVVYFNPDLDLAVLHVNTLYGRPLPLVSTPVPDGTQGAILGYPLGANFTADPGTILESFTAKGRNIYNQGNTTRQIYSIKTDVRDGNSGGPVINKDGQVIGVVFAKSVNYDHVGYALAMPDVITNINAAHGRTDTIKTSCAE